MTENHFPVYLGKIKCPFCDKEFTIYEEKENLYCECGARGEIRNSGKSFSLLGSISWIKYLSTDIYRY